MLESCLKHVRHFLEICRDSLEICLRLHRDMFYTFCFEFMRHLFDIRFQIDLTEKCREAYQHLLKTIE